MNNAKYTVQLKTLMEQPETAQLLNKALSTYPLYEKKSNEEFIPAYIPTREQLNKKILNFYKYREIGFETPARFFDELEISMNEIMPYYNQLFFTADQDYNIIFNVDYHRTIKTEKAGTTDTNTTGTEKTEITNNETNDSQSSATDKQNTKNNMADDAKTVHSATPQGAISIPSKDIDGVPYADDVQWNKNNSNSTGESSGENSSETHNQSEGTNISEGNNTVISKAENAENESTREETKGNFGVVSAQDLVAKYREIIVNIEQQIINDERIKELFMMVW